MTIIVDAKFELLVPAGAPNLMVVTTKGCTGWFEQDRSTAIKITVVPYQKKKKKLCRRPQISNRSPCKLSERVTEERDP